MKLLRSGRLPKARLGTVIEMIGKRGTVGELDYIYQQAMAGRFAPLDTNQGPRRSGRGRAGTRDPKPDQDREKLIRAAPGG